jgi:hypothetical protein
MKENDTDKLKTQDLITTYDSKTIFDMMVSAAHLAMRSLFSSLISEILLQSI